MLGRMSVRRARRARGRVDRGTVKIGCLVRTHVVGERGHLAVQTPDLARVFVLVDTAIEDDLAHFPVEFACDEGVGAGLVGDADALDA